MRLAGTIIMRTAANVITTARAGIHGGCSPPRGANTCLVAICVTHGDCFNWLAQCRMLSPLAGLTDAPLLARVEQCVAAVSDLLQNYTHDNSCVVMTGCGTSGRMAFWAARAFNRTLAERGLKPRFRYLVSGTDSALLLSDELPEVSGASCHRLRGHPPACPAPLPLPSPSSRSFPCAGAAR